jgi:DNA replication protein DnaC
LPKTPLWQHGGVFFFGANLFFQLISRRYERGPMILTSNQSFAA